MTFTSRVVLLTLAAALPARGALRGCDDGIACGTVAANGFEFDCRFAGDFSGGGGGGEAVMLLHGFPEWSSMYMPLMRQLADAGYHALACNQVCNNVMVLSRVL